MKSKTKNSNINFFEDLQNLMNKYNVTFRGNDTQGIVNFYFQDEKNTTYEAIIFDNRLDILKQTVSQVYRG